MRTPIFAAIALSLTLPAVAPAAGDAKRKAPYLASIRANPALMRTGPGRTYPASWLYQRSGLPVRVIAVLKEWRRIQDPDAAKGWMHVNLLSETRTAVVRSAQPIEMRERPSPAGRVMWRAARGVVGKVSACTDGWCRFDVEGRAAYVEVAGLWGVESEEVLP